MSKDFCPPHRRPLLSVHTDKQPTGRSNQTRNDLLLLSGVSFSRVSTSVGCPPRPHSGVCVLQLSRSDQTALPMSRTATAAPEMRRALTSQLLLTGSILFHDFISREEHVCLHIISRGLKIDNFSNGFVTGP